MGAPRTLVQAQAQASRRRPPRRRRAMKNPRLAPEATMGYNEAANRKLWNPAMGPYPFR